MTRVVTFPLHIMHASCKWNGIYKDYDVIDTLQVGTVTKSVI